MNSIKSKLWLGNVLQILIILLIIWVFQIGLLKYFYVHERTNQFLEEGQYIASLIEKTGRIEDLDSQIIDEINSFTESVHCRFVILDTANEIIYPKNIPQQDKLDNAKKPDDLFTKFIPRIIEDYYLEPTLSKGEIFIRKNFHPARSFLLVGVPIKTEYLMGNILFHYSLAPVEETTFILQRQLSIISFICLILGTIIALFFAQFFTKPLLKITEAAQKISKGFLDTKIEINSPDEIGTLGKVINKIPEKLQQIESFRRDFITNISHELKTPISLISAYAELIRDVDGKDEKARNKNLQVIIDEAHRLNNMVEDILFLSEIESGYAKHNPRIFPVMEVLNDVVNKLYYFAKEKNINIIINTENEQITAFADEEKMHQVFYNIINNAINYSNKNTDIIINISNDLKIEIIDSGEGIPKEDLPYIWDRFYKVDKSRKRNSNSTGLGLAIVKNILDTHNFPYGIESKVNKGTKIWLIMKNTN